MGRKGDICNTYNTKYKFKNKIKRTVAVKKSQPLNISIIQDFIYVCIYKLLQNESRKAYGDFRNGEKRKPENKELRERNFGMLERNSKCLR